MATETRWPPRSAQHPAEADALTEFDLGLLATASYTDAEASAPDVLEIAERARARAFAAVFGAQATTAAQPALAARSLKALRNARGLSLAALAAAVDLGLDVVSALEAGRIRLASIPQQLSEALGEALDATAEQIGAALAVNAAPALRRGQPGASTAANKQVDFTEAVMISQSMTPEQRARWLAASADRVERPRGFDADKLRVCVQGKREVSRQSRRAQTLPHTDDTARSYVYNESSNTI